MRGRLLQIWVYLQIAFVTIVHFCYNRPFLFYGTLTGWTLCITAYVCVYVFACMYVWKSVCGYICCVYVSVCLFVCLCVCVFLYVCLCRKLVCAVANGCKCVTAWLRRRTSVFDVCVSWFGVRLGRKFKIIFKRLIKDTIVVEYDEEADDRDRFKHDKFYNRVVMIGTPIMLSILFYMAYLGHTLERHFDQDKYVPYPYLTVRNNVRSLSFHHFWEADKAC